MAERLGEAVLEITTDDTAFNAGIGRAERGARALGEKFTRIGQGMTLAVTTPLVFFGAKARRAAVDAEELQSAFNFSFGQMAKDMNTWAVATGDSLGRSTQLIQEQAFQFNQLFKAALQPEQAAQLSQQFTLLANDLSSFFNVTETDALDKLRAGLVGETEPLRTFGVFINEAAIQAKALEMGVISLGEKLTDQQKIAVRAALIMEQTADAQGDLARTADSAANKERELGAEVDELKVSAGTLISDALTPIVSKLTEWVRWLKTLNPNILQWAVGLAGVAAVTGPVLLGMGGLLRIAAPLATGLVHVASGLSGVLLRLVPMLLPLAAVAGLITAVVVAWANWDKIQGFLSETYNAVKDWISNRVIPQLRNLVEHLAGIAQFFGMPAKALLKLLEENGDAIAEVVKGAGDSAKTVASDVMASLSGIGQELGNTLGGMATTTIEKLSTFGDMALEVVTSSFSQLMDNPLIAEAIASIKTQFQGLRDAIFKPPEGEDPIAQLAAQYGSLPALIVPPTEDAVSQITKLYKNGILQIPAFTRLSMDAQKETLVDGLGQSLQVMGDHSKKAFKVNKAFALSQAIVSTAQGVAQALRDVPFPYNLAAAAVVAAQGIGQIATIKSQSFAGGGGGGYSFGGSGGGGGAAQQPQIAAPPIVSAEERNQGRIRVVLEGGDDVTRALVQNARVIVDNEDESLVGAGSRQALELQGSREF